MNPWKLQIALLGTNISSDVEIKNEVACRIAKFLDVIFQNDAFSVTSSSGGSRILKRRGQ